jgi:NAD(P)-dependent dehydrogenase (short-subunit alcohol dehydrogenase family)
MSVVVVTGAASGMGRACVDALREPADTLVAVDLEKPDLAGTVGLACDVSDPADVARLAEQVRSLGPFASLVHAAGISPTMGDPRRIFEVDLVGTQLLLDQFSALVAPGSAAVCFASSAAHQIGLLGRQPELDALVEDPLAPGFLDDVEARFDDSGIAYAWAKRGVIRAAARAAVTWGARGGRVTSLSPGMIDTGMGQQELASQPMMQVMLDATPLKRLGRAQEIAAVVAFLLSEGAAFLTGADLLVDGGCLEALKGLAASDSERGER